MQSGDPGYACCMRTDVTIVQVTDVLPVGVQRPLKAPRPNAALERKRREVSEANAPPNFLSLFHHFISDGRDG